jgi:hypothetical protein
MTTLQTDREGSIIIVRSPQVRDPKGLGSQERLRLGLMDGVGVLGVPPGGLGQRERSMIHNQSRIRITS